MQTDPQLSLRESSSVLRQAQAEALCASPDAAPAWRNWLRNLAIALAAGVFLAIVGAMQTGGLPLITRLLYWAPMMLTGSLLGHGMSALVIRLPHARTNKWLFGALLSAALSVPVTLAVWAYTNLIFHTQMGLPALPQLYGSVLVISAAMSAIMIAANWPGRVTHAAPEAAAPVRFLERLPPKLKGAILYAVSAEDHYLRLHTSKGSDLILMRLSDAISELEGLEGAQTHRSWWVARCAIEGARREGGRAVLVLKGGAEAPVSRPSVRPLREAGWF